MRRWIGARTPAAMERKRGGGRRGEKRNEGNMAQGLQSRRTWCHRTATSPRVPPGKEEDRKAIPRPSDWRRATEKPGERDQRAQGPRINGGPIKGQRDNRRLAKERKGGRGKGGGGVRGASRRTIFAVAPCARGRTREGRMGGGTPSSFYAAGLKGRDTGQWESGINKEPMGNGDARHRP